MLIQKHKCINLRLTSMGKNNISAKLIFSGKAEATPCSAFSPLDETSVDNYLKQISLDRQTEPVFHDHHISLESDDFCKEIGYLKGMGIDVTFTKDLSFLLKGNFTEQEELYIDKLTQLLLNKFNEAKINLDFKHPLKKIKEDYIIQKEISSELRVKEASIYSSYISIEKTTNGTIKFNLINLLNPKNPIVLQENISLINEETIQNITNKLNNKYLFQDPIQKELLEKIPILKTPEPIISLDPNTKAPNFYQNMSQVLAKGYSVIMRYTPKDESVDRSIQGTPININEYNGYELNIDETFLENTNKSRLKIDGAVERLYFSRNLSEEEFVTQDVVLDERRPTIDKFNNLVLKTVIRNNIDSDNPYTEIIGVNFVPRTSENYKSSTQPLTFELEALGLGDFSDGISIQTIPKIATLENVTINSFIPSDKILYYWEQLKKTINGIKDFQRIFGIDEGQVNRIIINKANQNNAFASENAPNVIFINSPHLFENFISLHETGIHESAHLFDYYHKFSSKNVKFNKKWSDLSLKCSEILTFFNEKNFLKTSKNGHSEDNAQELFASIINSVVLYDINKDAWRTTVKASSKGERETYIYLLNTIYEALPIQIKNSKNIPAPKIIHSMIKDLSAL